MSSKEKETQKKETLTASVVFSEAQEHHIALGVFHLTFLLPCPFSHLRASPTNTVC